MSFNKYTRVFSFADGGCCAVEFSVKRLNSCGYRGTCSFTREKAQ